MISTELKTQNRQTWKSILAFVDASYPQTDYYNRWKASVRPLILAGIDAGFDEYFRAGQSMIHIIFSTAEKHGLEQYEPPPPRITLATDESRAFLAWSYGNIMFCEPEEIDFIDAETAQPKFKAKLVKLWKATRTLEPLPPPLL